MHWIIMVRMSWVFKLWYILLLKICLEGSLFTVRGGVSIGVHAAFQYQINHKYQLIAKNPIFCRSFIQERI
jgi:hypothetical protein